MFTASLVLLIIALALLIIALISELMMNFLKMRNM